MMISRFKYMFVFVAVMVLSMAVKGATYTVNTVPNVQLKDSTQFVSDPDGYLSAEAKAQINRQLMDVRRKSTAEVAVVVVGSIEGGDINSFASDLFDTWGLGKKKTDNGLLFLVSVNDRQFSIRTGRGTEIVMTDAMCGRIGRNVIVPAFKRGDYVGGVVGAVSEFNKILTTDDAVEELRANAERDETTWSEVLIYYLWFCVVLTLTMGVILAYRMYRLRGKSHYEKYMSIFPTKSIILGCSFFGLGLPLLLYFPVRRLLKGWRDGQHQCPNCNTSMVKLDEETDNEYLTPAQDAEERFKSVDYDVWLCPACGETDVYPYYNQNNQLKPCPHCHARTLRHTMDRVLIKPTEYNEGQGVHAYCCLNCGKLVNIPYKIAKTVSAPVIIIPGGGGFGSGGSGGGSFGGGSTGGGGYNGGW